MTTQAENVTTEQMKPADLAYVSPSGQETPLTDDQLVAAAQNTAPVGTSGASASMSNSASTTNYDQTPVRVGQSASNNTGRTRLPRTSTVLPLIGILGLSSLLGGTFRLRRR